MSVVGVASVIYGVEDLDLATQFYEDFGLSLARRTGDESVFALAEGSSVVLRRIGDPGLAPAWFEGPGVREAIFGVDSTESLDALADDLGRDRDLRRDDDGTVHFVSDDGIPFGLQVYNRRPVPYAPDPVNAPGNIARLNQNRKWRTRAMPKVLHHVVFRVLNPEASFSFFQDRLGFRLSDISRGLGFFARARGAPEHHNIFFLQNGALGPDEDPGFHHVCFGVEDIDELLTGANYMQRRGYQTDIGLGRHRIASSLFYYLFSPCGGMAEYGADTDYLDDNWVPRVWDPSFGAASVMAELPPFMAEEPPWDVGFVKDYLPSADASRALGQEEDPA